MVTMLEDPRMIRMYSKTPLMSDVFPEPCGIIGYGGVTVKELNE